MPNSALLNPPSGSNVTILATTGIPTNYVPPPYPAIFSLLPLEGTFKWSLSWEGHPSGSFEFRTYAYLKQTVLQTLTAGTEFSAWGIGFRTGSLSIVEVPASSQPLRIIQVSVPLEGKHENYVERIVPLRSLNSPDLDTIPSCLDGLTQAQADAIGLLAETSVAELATRAGDRFVGPPMPVVISADTPSTEGTTFITHAQEQVRMNGCFLQFSEDRAVRALALNGVPTWTFQEPDIRSAVNSTLGNQVTSHRSQVTSGIFHPKPLGTILPSSLVTCDLPLVTSEDQSVFPYVHLYEPPYRLEGNFVEYLTVRFLGTTQGTAAIFLKPQWKKKPSVQQIIPEGDEHPEVPPANSGPLKDLSNLFSQSGVTKTFKVTTLLDDMPVSEHHERWGDVFLGTDMYSGDNLVGATNTWQKVEEKDTTYQYDPNFGYQLGSTTVGWELVRFDEEDMQQDDKNTKTLTAAGDPESLAKLQLYEYFQNPYRKEERHYLEPLVNYYKNVETPPFPTLCKVPLPSGQYELYSVPDPTWYEPYFAKVSAIYENNFKSIPHPKNAPPDVLVPPATTGKESFHRTLLTINDSKNSKVVSASSVAEDSYNTYESQFSSQDAGYANSLDNTSFQRSSGRPGIHTRRAAQYSLIPPESQIGVPIQGRNFTNYFAYTTRSGNYQINPAALATSLQGGSLSYSAARTLEQAQLAAQTEITIKNMQDVLQESFTIPFSPQIREGDRLTYICNGEVRLRRILSISHEVEIKGLVDGVPIITSNGSQVSVGLERETKVTFKTERKPKVTTSMTYVPNTSSLGELIAFGLESRRNF